jgi:subtilisin-like proprotein convertase family protein
VADSREPKAPFGDTKAVTSAIQLSAEGDVSTEEFEVDVDIMHTYRGDVQLELEAPSGKRITLMSIDTSDAGDDVKGTYPTTLQSLTPFSELAGEALSGTWTLHVSDQFRGDDGVLNSWAITQNQFVFPGRGASSPIQVQGLPTDQSYDCSIAGVYSEVTPPRQSESKTAGTVALGSPPVTSLAETAFLNLLQTVLAFDPTAAGSGDSTESDNSSLSDPSASGANDPGAKEGELGGSKGVNPAEKDDPRPNAIPTFGAWGLGALLSLMGLMGLRYGRISGKRQ